MLKDHHVKLNLIMKFFKHTWKTVGTQIQEIWMEWKENLLDRQVFQKENIKLNRRMSQVQKLNALKNTKICLI